MKDKSESEIQQAIMRAMSVLGINESLSHQSISFVGLSQMLRDIQLDKIVIALKSMEGVIFNFEAGEVQIPSNLLIYPT